MIRRCTIERSGNLPWDAAHNAEHGADRRLVELGSRPDAVLLDAEVVGSLGELEPALFTPVRAPTVAANPVVLSVLGAVPRDGDGVVHRGAVGVILEDSRLVRLKRRRDADAALDGSTRADLSHHLLQVLLRVGVVDTAELVHVELGEVVGHAIIRAHRVAALLRVAVAADAHAVALEVIVQILGLVVLARLVDGAVGLDPGVHFSRIAALAAASTLGGVLGRGHAVDELLRRQEHVGEGVLARKLEAVVERGRGGVRPARTAVLRDVLVAVGRRVVDLVLADGADVVARRGVLEPRERRSHMRRGGFAVWAHVAALRVVEKGTRGHFRVGLERARRVGSCRVHLHVLEPTRLGRWGGPRARALDAQVVTAHLDLCVPVLAPVGAPRVAKDPVVSVRLVFAPTDDAQNVVGQIQDPRFLEDAAGVAGHGVRRPECLELVGSVDAAGEGAAGHNFSLQLLLGTDRLACRVDIGAAEHVTVFTQSPQSRLLDLGARPVGDARLADAQGLAVVAVVGRLVVLASLVGEAFLLHVVKHTADVAAVARAAAAAVDEHLRGQNGLGPRALARDLDAVVERREGTKRPACAAVLRDVLVAALSEEVGTIDVAPVPVVRKIRGDNLFVRTGREDFFLAQPRAAVELRLGRGAGSDRKRGEDGEHVS